MKIGILTDSTCDLPKAIIDNYNIEIIPLKVHLFDKTYQDGIEISSEEFFDKLENVNILNKLPTTSQPSLGLFMEKFKKMSKEYDQILSIHLASALSGTYEVATIASRNLPEINIRVIDSKSASLGLGFQVMLAAQMIQKNKGIDTIIDILTKARKNLNIYFTVYDLEFLKKGGRISKTKAFLGSILHLNPILKLNSDTGEIIPYDKVRGTSKTINKIINLALKGVKQDDKVWLGLPTGNIDKYHQKYKEKTTQFLKDRGIIELLRYSPKLSPVLGSHVGPYLYGLVVLKGDYIDNE